MAKLPIRSIYLYGLLMGLLLFVLKWMEYRFWVRDFSYELYLGLIATLFMGLGFWVGMKIVGKKSAGLRPSSPSPELAKEPEPNPQKLEELGISPREYEVLQLISQGMSNQEIADTLFVSLNTVKTHTTRLFSKLDVRRRTQAVQKSKELNILP